MYSDVAAIASAQFEVSQGYGPVITLLIALLVIGMVVSGAVARKRIRARHKRDQ
jgi:tetrahydromethanopterin S-methyltransferase subunit C